MKKRIFLCLANSRVSPATAGCLRARMGLMVLFNDYLKSRSDPSRSRGTSLTASMTLMISPQLREFKVLPRLRVPRMRERKVESWNLGNREIKASCSTGL